MTCNNIPQTHCGRHFPNKRKQYAEDVLFGHVYGKNNMPTIAKVSAQTILFFASAGGKVFFSSRKSLRIQYRSIVNLGQGF
jgi:hypothetical protein